MIFEEFVQVFIIGLLIFLPVSLIYKKSRFSFGVGSTGAVA